MTGEFDMSAPTEGSILEEGIGHEHFHRHQERHMRVFRARAKAIAEAIARHGAAGPVLDVGVGTGHFLLALAQRMPGGGLHGVDNDPAMIEYARRRLADRPDVTLAVADARDRLPYPDGFFGSVISMHTFHHIDRVDDALREIARVLAPGGVFVLIDLDPARPLARVFRRVYPILKALGVQWPIGEGAHRSLARSIGQAQMTLKLEAAGWTVRSLGGKRMDFTLATTRD